jgi:ABC-type glutathione transport system ATPase component
MVEIHEQAPGKRIRKKRAKKPVSLLSLGSTLDEIMAEDKRARARKAEVSRPLKTGELRAERERFRAVMEHPQFKANPLKTIREHVENVWERKEGMAL